MYYLAAPSYKGAQIRVGTQKKFMTAGARAHEAHFKCCCFMVYVIFICCTKEPTFNEEHYVLATCNSVSNNVWRSIFKEDEGSCMGNRQKNKWNVWWIQTW